MDLNVIYLWVAAFLGSIATGLLGWTQSSEPWNWKKFTTTLLRALVGGVAIAAAVDYSGATVPIVYLIAFLSGAGVDVGGNRIAGAIAAKNKK